MPITVRWVGLALVLVGGTAFTVGTLSYVRARDALTTTATTRLTLHSHDVAQGLSQALMDRAVDITTWARLETMLALTFGDVDKELTALLEQTIRTDPSYVALAGFDAHGHRVAVAGDASRVPAASEAVGTQPLLSIEPDPGRHERLLRLACAVEHPRRPGERIGMLVALLDPRRLLASVAAARVRDGLRVTWTADDSVLAAEGPVAEPGEPTLDATVGMPSVRALGAPHFTVLVRQPARVALAGVAALRRSLLRTAAGIVLLSALLGGLFAWRQSVPIRRLTAAVERVTADGRPEAALGLPASGGEVGVLTDSFNAMLERLAVAQRELVAQSRLALLGEVAASIVHDVRTPLSVLKTSAQLLGDPARSPAERQDLAAMVAAEVDRLNRVVTQLADLGRRPPGRRAARATGPLVERAIAVLRPWIRAQHVTLTVRGDETLAVTADADAVAQAILNVVHNAVQAAGPGGSVAITWHAAGDALRIDVTDSGPGFAPDALAKATTPFFTTKVDGTGLGLAIARRVAVAHGGTVIIDNRAGGGACVSITLDRSPTPAA